MADVFDRNQRCYIAEQSAFGTAATVTGSNCCLIINLNTAASQNEIQRPDKTGTLDEVLAQGGRRIGNWSASMSGAGNGTAGVVPDCNFFLKSVFCKAPTIVGGTSVTYALDDTLFYYSIYNYVQPSGADQMVAFDCIGNKLEYTFGGDVPLLNVSGENTWVFDSAQAADGTTPAGAKGGLSSMAAEPGTPVVNGTFPPGFKLTATIDGNAYTTLISGRIALDVARELRKIGNSEFAGAGAAGLRQVTHDFTLVDDDSSQLQTLKDKAMNRTPINATYTVGTVAGNRWVWTINNFILSKPTYGTNGIRRTCIFNGCHAYPSTLTAKDQLTLVIN